MTSLLFILLSYHMLIGRNKKNLKGIKKFKEILEFVYKMFCGYCAGVDGLKEGIKIILSSGSFHALTVLFRYL